MHIIMDVCTIAQLLSNVSRVVIGWKEVNWRVAGQFLITAAPLTALGAYGFSIAPKSLMTQILSVSLIIFAIMKLRGKMHLPH